MSKKNVALITGITGQDGSYLAEYLLKLGYQVHGIKRRTSSENISRIRHLLNYQSGSSWGGELILHHGDLTDSSSIQRIVKESNPTEIYNLAAQSHVGVSFDEPEYTANADGLGCLRMLEAIKHQNRDIKFYQASTSELFGGCDVGGAYDESSLINPRSPYAAAKAYAHYLTVQYRVAFGMFACNGILFNHESPRRGEHFVSQKVVRGVQGLLEGTQKEISLGNLNAVRDWGHAEDYVMAMHLILQHHNAKDWVVATGESFSVREFCLKSFAYFDVDIGFEGTGESEIGRIIKSKVRSLQPGSVVITVDKRLFRPLEVPYLKGDARAIRRELNWKPKHNLDSLIEDMFKKRICKEVST
jgi:GDPmannose 4,6-dehydratase